MNAKRTVLSAAAMCVAIASTAWGAGASITTSQKQYSVGETMTVLGTGFTPQAQVTLTVQRPDHLIDDVPNVFSDSTGAFTATYTPPLESGRYTFTATDGANSANTASTEADAIGYNKGVYNKGSVKPEDQTGSWTTGNAGKNYLENQWTFYQYEITGVGATIPSFDVYFNHFQSATDAVFIDALADFRACVDCTDHTDLSGPSQGLLTDTNPVAPQDTTNWKLLTVQPPGMSAAGYTVSHVNRPLYSTSTGTGGSVVTSGSSGYCSSDLKEPVPDGTTTFPAQFHCFHVDGGNLATNISYPSTGTHTITIFFAAHLAASFVWGNGTGTVGGHEASLGDCTSPYYATPLNSSAQTAGVSFEPLTGGCNNGIPIYGTDAYAGWTANIFGVGFASGSSRHFELANQTAGSNGAIDLPIPTVSAPSNRLVITKATVPSNATNVTFPFTSAEVGNFSLSSPFPSSQTFTSIAPGVEYDVTETGVSGWTLTSSACQVTNGTDDGTGTWPMSGTNNPVAVTFGATDSGVTITCTFTNTGTAHLIVQKHTTPSATGQSFHYTTSGSNYAGFSLLDGGSNTDGGTSPSGGLNPGTYTVSEDAVAGWALQSRTCSLTVTGTGTSTFPASGTTQPASITLGAGDTVTCVYNNVRPDARITLSPLSAINEIGQPHTFTATVQQDTTGGGTFTNAPDGTLVTFSLPGSPAGVSFVGGINTCTTTGGSCSVQVTSTSATSATIHATTTLTVSGVSLTRSTGDNVSGDSADAVKHWVDANIAITPLTATNLVGQSHTFTVTVTQIPDGATPATSATLTAQVTPAPGSITDNCSGTKSFSGNTITCTIVINSTATGTFTAHVSASIPFPSGPTLTRATGDGVHNDSADAVKHYVDGNITITPSAVNEVNHAHTFTVTVTQIPDGSTPATTASITPNVSPAGTVTGTTCSASVAFSGNTATCTITVNSSTVQTITANASASFSIDGATVSVATGDSHTGDGPAATKQYVDAGITITPSAVNEVGHEHVFTITYTQIPGTATPATTASITPNVSPAGTVTGTTCSASVAFSGNTATCTVTVNSTTVQTITANATGVASVGGVTLTRATGDSNANDGSAATKSYVDANVSITPNGTNEVGQAHIFTITVNALPGAVTPVAFTSITPSVTPAPSSQSTTCGSPTIVSNTATCTLTINSTTAGVFTANATAIVTMGGVAVTRSTGDGKTGDSGPAVKTYIKPGTILSLTTTVPTAVESGSTVTIGVRETNTGSGTLTNVFVSGGGACSGNVSPSTSTTLAAGAYQDYTCTFTAVTGANAWSLSGHGTDELNNPVPTGNGTPEYQSGSVSGLLSNLILVKNTVGGNGTFTFSESPEGPGSFPVTTSGGTQTVNFTNIQSGGKTLTETVPAGWLGNTTDVFCSETVPGISASSIGTLTTGTVAAGGTVTANVILGIGATVKCTFTNALLPKLTVEKTIQGNSTTFVFDTTSPNGFLPSSITATPPTNGTAASPDANGLSIPIGDYTISENLSGTPGWLLTDFSCTGVSFNTTATGVSFTADYGQNIVCKFSNAQQGGATRTQGFWSTHTVLANDIWNGTPLPPGTSTIPATPVAGGADALLCTTDPITAISAYPPNPGANELMGGFWANIAATTSGKGRNAKRSPLDQSRMQLLQQYFAAVLNVHAFGTAIIGTDLATARAAYCGTDTGAIKTQLGLLGTYNSMGDTVNFTPGVQATTQESKSEADIPFWDNTYR
jgi:hypothetical protein